MLTIPYTYLIGWPDLNLWYYGVRYASGCNPSDLWVTYFTSSKLVANLVRQHGAPPVRIIRKTFKNPIAAKLWENRVLRKMKVVESIKWINQNDRMGPPILAGDQNPMKTRPEVRAKCSATKKAQNITRSPEWRAHHSAVMKGRKPSAETLEKKRQAMLAYGDAHKSKTVEFRKARSEELLANNPMSRPEVRAKQSVNKKGKPWSAARRNAQNKKKDKQ